VLRPELLEDLEQAVARAQDHYRDRCIDDFGTFIRAAWPVVDPAPYEDNWHVGAVAAELQAFDAGGDRELYIGIPPGLGKSLIASVFRPAWVWLHDPGRRTLYTSNDDDLVKRDSRRTRMVLRSDWYRGLVARAASRGLIPQWEIRKDQDQKHYFENTAGGFRQAVPWGGAVTGKRPDEIVIDDPYDAKTVVLGNQEQVARRMAEVVDTYDNVLTSRIADQRKGKVILIMQRLAEGDLAEAFLTRGARSIVLPMTFDPSRAHPRDRRTEPGELLDPRRFPAEVLSLLKSRMGRHYRAQYEQQPTATEGGVLRRSWFRRFPRAALPELDEVAMYWDFASATGPRNDYTAGLVLGRRGPHVYGLASWHGRVELSARLVAVESMLRQYPQARRKVFELYAKGKETAELLAHKFPGILVRGQTKSKAERADAAATYLEAGNVWLPEGEEWAEDVIDECASFPTGAHDDLVDVLCMGVLDQLDVGAAGTFPVYLAGDDTQL
jgi:predicted phage terminase large subunit-like protein